MIREFLIKHIWPTFCFLAFFTLLLGGVYPLLITAISQFVFPHQANGSLIVKGQQSYGSALIGQSFHSYKYFWGRLSATEPEYNAAASAGSNLSPANPLLITKVKNRINSFKMAAPLSSYPIPVDLLTHSASGLDPHISIHAARYQANRIAAQRNVQEQVILELIEQNTEDRQFGILGEPRVNVLKLNLGLDQLKAASNGK